MRLAMFGRGPLDRGVPVNQRDANANAVGSAWLRNHAAELLDGCEQALGEAERLIALRRSIANARERVRDAAYCSICRLLGCGGGMDEGTTGAMAVETIVSSLGDAFDGPTQREIERLRAMEQRMVVWAAELESAVGQEHCHGGAGQFIAAEIRRRLAEPWVCPALSNECAIRRTCTNKCGRKNGAP
jgi:hypothetical protein